MENLEEVLIHGLEESSVRTYVGKNADYYVEKWKRVKTINKSVSWNWGAFLAGFIWLGYRKMYKTVFMLIGLFCVMDAGCAIFLGTAPSSNAYSGAYASIGVLGTRMYFSQMKKAIEKAETNFPGNPDAQKAAISKSGGVSWRGAVLVSLLMCAYAFTSSMSFNYLSQSSLERGIEQIKAGQPTKAITELDQALRYNNESHKAYGLRGLLYSETGEYDKAIKDMTVAIKLAPKNDKYYYYRASVFTKQGSTDQAINDYTKALELNSKNTEALLQRGNIYATGSKFDLAIADYSNVIALNPNFALAYYNLAIAYDKTSKYKEAANDFSQFLALNPTGYTKEVEISKIRLVAIERMRQ